MTTVVYRDGFIAGDTGVSIGGVSSGFMSKVARNCAGDLAGVSGHALSGQRFLEWFAGGERGDLPPAIETTDLLDRWIVIRRRTPSQITIIETEGRLTLTAPYYALGSGREVALGALFMGATAELAVHAALEHNAESFGEVEVLDAAGS